jgi:molybdopterin molybdotransferase
MPSARATDYPVRISVDEARARVLDVARAHRVATDRVPLDRALGRVLAVDVVAPHPLPPFANSAMDGYALRGADLPREGEKRFRNRGVMLAGTHAALEVGAGECVRITTGAPLPRGADTVVIKENVRVEGDAIVVPAGDAIGANVRPAGEDLPAGAFAARAGERLTAARLGLVASCGLASVAVAKRPRVALFVTGDELVPPGKPLGFGQIHDSNRYSIGGLLEGAGIVAEPIAHLRDDVDALRDALAQAASTCDVVITSGGVSAGEADHVTPLVAELGRIDFWKVRMKPGMPFLCGEIGRAIVFALPGNPVSSMATFLALVEPALRAMQGDETPERRWRAQLAEPVRKKHDRTEFLRARIVCGDDGVLRAGPVERQGSGQMGGAVEADALVVVGEDVRSLGAGELVDVLFLPGAVR